MNIDTLIRILIENDVPNKITETLISDFADSKPYLPVFDPYEIWDTLHYTKMDLIAEALGVDSDDHLLTEKLIEALSVSSDSTVRVIANTRKGSHDNVLYDPREWTSQTLITIDFIDYVLDTGTLIPYAVNELATCLKRNHIDYELNVVEIPEPGEDELMTVIFEGLLRMAKDKPNVFQREVAIAMREKGIDAKKYTRTTMFNAVKDAKIIHG